MVKRCDAVFLGRAYEMLRIDLQRPSKTRIHPIYTKLDYNMI